MPLRNIKIQAHIGLAVVLAVSLVVSWGCEDVELGWGDQPKRSTRPTPRPIQPTAPSTAPSSAATKPAAPDRPGPPANAQEPTFYQLILQSQAVSETTPGLQYVRVTRASAQAAGELLSRLYPPAGLTRTDQRCTLVYSSRLECDAAAKMAGDLDVSASDQPVGPLPGDSNSLFNSVVGALYGTPPGSSRESERLQTVEDALFKIARTVDQPPLRRWAAAMIAGTIRADRLHGLDQAEAHFRDAQEAAPPGSLERLAAVCALARVYTLNGKPAPARELLTGVIRDDQTLKRTEAYRRAGEMLAGLDRKRAP